MNEKSRATAQGIIALLFWGSTIAFSRSLAEKLGTLTAASYIFLLAGGLSCMYLVISRRLQGIVHVSRAYLFGCGALFIVYMATLYVAIGSAANRLQVLEVGLVNYKSSPEAISRDGSSRTLALAQGRSPTSLIRTPTCASPRPARRW